MSFEWSTPARSTGQQSLDPIPVEIYLKIFDFLENDPLLNRNDLLVTLLSFTPVCRLFCSIAFSRIFSSIRIMYDTLDTDQWAKRGSALLRAIHAKKPWALAMAHIPVSVSLGGFYNGGGGNDWARAGLLKLFISPLRRMQNLQSLTLDFFKSDLRSTQIICGLNLTSLALRNCAFAEDVAVELLGNAKGSKLEHLTVFSAHMQAPRVSKKDRFIAVMQVILDLSHLKSLTLFGRFDVMKTIMGRLIELPDHSNLKRLEVVHSQNAEPFLEFFKEFPLLEHLFIGGLASQKPSQGPRPQIWEQNMVHLQCPQQIIQLFAPFHQLRSLDIRTGGLNVERIPFTHFHCMADSWTRIRELRLPFYIYAENPIPEMCSSLLHLSLETDVIGSDEETLQSQIARFKPAPLVLTFTIWGHVRNKGSKEKLLQSLADAFPRIEEFRLAQELGRWIRAYDGSWRLVDTELCVRGMTPSSPMSSPMETF